jgi:2-oxoglutarate ferredoxin oxidoreductase subunit gamma
MERYTIIFSGSGGQGVITAAIILAETADLYEGLNAVQSQSYGPEARGSATRTDVIISNTDILYPKVIQPDMLVCLTQEAYKKYSGLIREGGLVLVDNYYVKQEAKLNAKQIGLDMYNSVMDEIGKPMVLNICMLGAFAQLTQIVRQESIIKVLEARIPDGTLELNRKALELGVHLAKELDK